MVRGLRDSELRVTDLDSANWDLAAVLGSREGAALDSRSSPLILKDGVVGVTKFPHDSNLQKPKRSTRLRGLT